MREKDKWYRVANPINPDYFKEKYGTENPVVYIDGTDEEILGCSYLDDNRPVSMVFFKRIAGKLERLPQEGVYATKMEDPKGYWLSELVLEQELDETESEDQRGKHR